MFWGKDQDAAADIVHKMAYLQPCSDPKEGEERISGEGGSWAKGMVLQLELIVHKSHGTIEQISYKIFGPPALVLTAELGCKFTQGKSHKQLERCTEDQLCHYFQKILLTKQLPFPSSYINVFLDAILDACEKCQHIPCSPVIAWGDTQDKKEHIAHWLELGLDNQLKIIDSVLDQHIRPYIHSDAGEITIVALETPLLLRLRYGGACVGCFAAGSTLTAITALLQEHVHPELVVVEENQRPSTQSATITPSSS